MTTMLLFFSFGSLTACFGVVGVTDNVNAVQLHITEDHHSRIHTKCGTCNGCRRLEMCHDLARHPTVNEKSCVQNGGVWCAVSFDGNESSLGSFGHTHSNEACLGGLEKWEDMDWKNDWDDQLDFKCDSRRVVTSVFSEHHNDKEDRRWKVGCSRVCGGTAYSDGFRSGSAKTGRANNWDGNMKYECPPNSAVVGLYSSHDNAKEDRRWDFTCDTVDGAKISPGTFSRDFLNEWDKDLKYSCPLGKVLTGLESRHDNGKEDRRWKLKCGSIVAIEYPCLDKDGNLAGLGREHNTCTKIQKFNMKGFGNFCDERLYESLAKIAKEGCPVTCQVCRQGEMIKVKADGKALLLQRRAQQTAAAAASAAVPPS